MLPPPSEERSLVIYWWWRRFINPHERQAQLQLLLNLLILIFSSWLWKFRRDRLRGSFDVGKSGNTRSASSAPFPPVQANVREKNQTIIP